MTWQNCESKKRSIVSRFVHKKKYYCQNIGVNSIIQLLCLHLHFIRSCSPFIWCFSSSNSSIQDDVFNNYFSFDGICLGILRFVDIFKVEYRIKTFFFTGLKHNGISWWAKQNIANEILLFSKRNSNFGQETSIAKYFRTGSGIPGTLIQH